MKKQKSFGQRRTRLMPGGVPRYIRCYDNGGESLDNFTVVFTGNYRHKTGGEYWYTAMNSAPYHPQGIGQHGNSRKPIDRPKSGHLGKRISFRDLPSDCQSLVIRDYEYLWDIQL